MSGRSKLWRVVGVLYLGINLAGVCYALYRGEMMHATSHVALFLLGAGVWWGFTRPRVRAEPSSPIDQPLDNLQQSLDAIALEVERIGEAQRYIVKREVERMDVKK